MIRTEKIVSLSEALHGYKIRNWEEIFDKIKKLGRFKKESGLYFHEYQRFASEFSLDVCIDSLIRDQPELGISLDGFFDGNLNQRLTGKNWNNGDFNFNYTNGRIIVSSHSNGVNFEYDKIVLVDSKPVVIEMKISNWKGSYKQDKNKVKIKRGNGIQNSLRPRFYNRKLFPVGEFFQSDVSYIFIIPRDIYQNKEAYSLDNSIYNFFKEDGGIIVPFYTDKKGFADDVLKEIKKRNLKLLDASV